MRTNSTFTFYVSFVALGVLLLAAACGSSGGSGEADSGSQDTVLSDVHVPGPDAGSDVTEPPPDAALDSGVDAAEDMLADSVSDIAVDTLGDAAEDTSLDVGEDTATDTAVDALAEVAEDVADDTGSPVDIVADTTPPVDIVDDTSDPVDIVDDTSGPVDIVPDTTPPVDIVPDTTPPVDIVADTAPPVDAGPETQTCEDDCVDLGATWCAGAGIQECGYFDEDPCLDISAPYLCPEGQICLDDVCGTPTCTNQDCTTPYEAECDGTTGFKVCAPDPAEPDCLRLGPLVPCAAGNTCFGGMCIGDCVQPEVMLLVDRTASTTGDIWDGIELGLTTWAQAVESQVYLGIRTFPESDCTPGAATELALNNSAAVIAQLTDPSGSESTPLAAALSGLEAQFGAPNQGEVVVLLTDGTETCASTDDALAAAAALRARGARVDVIEVGVAYDGPFLEELAATGGGTVMTGPNDEAIQAALDSFYAQWGACQPARGGQACTGEDCSELGCAAGFHLCDGVCVSDLSPDSCGAACEPCPADPADLGSPTCIDGVCGLDCPDGTHPSDGECVPDDDDMARGGSSPRPGHVG